MTRFDSPVTDYMTSSLVSVSTGATLAEAERLLEQASHSSLAVVAPDGQLAGVISRTDLLRVGRLRSHMANDPTLLRLPHLLVRERMVAPVVTVDLTTPLRTAATIMVERHIHRVFVVEHGRPMGVVSTRDVMKAVVDERVARPLGDYMSRPVVAIDAGDNVGKATDLLSSAHVRGVVVTDNDWPVGIFTQTEALGAHATDPAVAVEEVMSVALLCLPETLPLFRAAHFALGTRARRILVVEARQMIGIVSGLDFARAAAGLTHP